MKVVGNFLKVSFDQFAKDWEDTFDVSDKDYIANIYKSIKLPERSTAGSAGYDFVSPLSFTLEPGEDIKIPTGIKVWIEKPGWVLMLFPRSGLGFKYYTALANTVGIVDQDYIYSDNEGHIFVKLRNEGNKTLAIAAGDKIVQGVFLKFGIIIDDNTTASRNGGFGSTGR